MKVQLNLTRRKNESFVVAFVLVDYNLALRKGLLLQVKDELLVSLHSEMTQVGNVQELEFLPTLVLVLIFDQILLHFVFYFRKDCHYLLKGNCVNIADVAVVLRLH